MKKLWLTLIALYASVLNAYTPVQGPLTLIDNPNKFGAIRATVNSNPQLQNEANIIGQFAQTLPPSSQTYQGIVHEIIQSQSPLALQTLGAFESVIMYMYHDKTLLFKIPFGTDFTYQGIRHSWINPISYLNFKNWLEDNNSELDQLLSELYQLAKIAHKKNPLMGSRMITKVNLYRHWRKYLLCGITSYLLYDRVTRKWEDTALYHFWNDYDYNKAGSIMLQDATNAKRFACEQGEKIYNALSNYWNRKSIHEQKSIQEKKESTKQRWLNHMWDDSMSTELTQL